MKKLLSCVILVLTFAAAHAEDLKFGPWFVGTSNGGESMYTATINDSKIVLGKYCFFSVNSCYWIVYDDTTCEDGAVYPALMNTDKSAVHVTLQCMKIGNGPKLVIKDPDMIDKTLAGTSKVGIAIALVSGRFNVYRFDTSNFSQSFDNLVKQFRREQANSTRSETL